MEYKKQDRLFAAEVMGDRNTVVAGPFKAAHDCVYKSEVIPICAGWLGEIGTDFVWIINTLAREAAFGDDGMSISPLVMRGRSLPSIMLQNFPRDTEVAIMNGDANAI